MASFTDQIPKFNPYIQQLPVEAMVQVGMEKQRRYDEGVQKIQSYIDNIAGLDVIHDADKAYLQSKLNDLGNNLRMVAAGDFSNFQLVNSVTGMATQIVKDPLVQNAVSSTANHRKNLEQIEKDAAEGKLSPDNKWYYDNQFSEYLRRPEAGQRFGGKYVRYYDIDKDVTEMMKAAHADEAEWEEFARNPDGSINADIMIEKAKKGLLSPKVRNIVDTVFSKPQVQQQLMISGLYTYRDYGPKDLLKTQEVSLAALTDKAMKMREKYALISSIDSEDAANADKAIVEIDNQINNYREEYNRFVRKLNTNPDAAKIDLYSQNLKERYVSNFSWEANSQKSKVSPQFDVGIRRATYNLAVAKEQFDQWAKRQELDISRANLAIAQDEANRKRLIAEGKLNPDGSPKVNYSLGAVDPSVAEGLGSQSFNESLEKTKNEMTQVGAELFTTLPGFSDLYIKQGDQYVPNTAKYGTGDAFAAKLSEAVTALNNAHVNGKVKPNLRGLAQRYFDLTSLSIQQSDLQREIYGRFGKVANQINQSVAQIQGAKSSYNLSWRNEDGSVANGNVTQQDLINLEIWRGTPVFGASKEQKAAAEIAKSQLTKKFGERNLDGLIQVVRNRSRETVSVRTPDLDLLRKFNIDDKVRETVSKWMKSPDVALAYSDMETSFKKAQQQKQYYYGTSNTAKPEDKLGVNQIFAAQVSALTGEKAGDYKKLISWLDATKPENLNNNLYDHYRGPDGQWYIQVRRNTGEGKFEYSEALPVSYDVVQSLGGRVNVNEQAFNDVFGGFLDLNSWNSTTRDVKSAESDNTAIMRRSVGKYSVGYHLKKFGGGYVPYAYIRDKNGNVLGNGIEIDFSVYSKDKSLTPAQRKMFSDAQTIISPADMLPKLNSLDEHFFDLLLQNR